MPLRNKPVWLFESGPTDTSADAGKAVPGKSAAALAAKIGARTRMIFGGRLSWRASPPCGPFPGYLLARDRGIGEREGAERARAA